MAQRVTVVPSWSGTEATSWNKKARTVTAAGTEATAGQTGILRIPVEGITMGHADQETEELGGTSDPNITEDDTPVKDVTSETVGSGKAGRAIVLVPPGLPKGEVDVLFHLHGHTIGYRQVKAAGGQTAPPPRDVQYDRIAQQLLETGAKMIAILPQGKFLSGFGPGEQKGVNVDAYVGQVFGLANLANYKPGRITLSGWSGGGAGVVGMIQGSQTDETIKARQAEGKRVKERSPSAARLPESSRFDGLFLFDSLYKTQWETVWHYLEAKLESEVGKLVETAGTSSDAAAATAAQIAWIHANGFRFRAIYTTGQWKNHKDLKATVDRWFVFGPHLKKITKGVATPDVIDELHKNYQVLPAGEGVRHNEMIGGVEEAGKQGVYTHENLAEAIQALPPGTTSASTAPAHGRAPAPVRPAAKTVPVRAPVGTTPAATAAGKTAGGGATATATKTGARPAKGKSADVVEQYALSQAERTKLASVVADEEALKTANEQWQAKRKAAQNKKLKAADRKALDKEAKALKKEVDRRKAKLTADRKKLKGKKDKATLAKHDIEADLQNVGKTVAGWYKDIDTGAKFLGLTIEHGIHEELKGHLATAEETLKTQTGIDDVKKLKDELKLKEIKGLRSPKNATGGSRPSMHSYGLAVDINYFGSPFVGNVEVQADDKSELTASHVIARAMLLVHQEEYDIIDPKQVRKGVGKQYDYLTYASKALETYFGLPDTPKQLDGLVAALKKSGKDTRNADAWKRQIKEDHDALTVAEGSDFSDHADPAKGFVDLDKRLVLALTDAGLYWGGMYNEAKDIMHFDWRAGTIKR